MGLNVGELIHEVTVQFWTEANAASGIPADTWTDAYEAFMSRMETRMSERFTAAQESAATATRWVMRFRDDMDPDRVDVQATRRLVHQGRVHDIRGARMIGRRDGIELMTLAGSRIE